MTTGSRAFRFPLLAASVLGLTGVALGAMGAHALKVPLTEHGTMQAWETAARYHLIHAVALLGLAAWVRSATTSEASRLLAWAAGLWFAGVILFSGSLYGLALGGPTKVLGPITPLGGIALMTGWLLLAIAAFSARRD